MKDRYVTSELSTFKLLTGEHWWVNNLKMDMKVAGAGGEMMRNVYLFSFNQMRITDSFLA